MRARGTSTAGADPVSKGASASRQTRSSIRASSARLSPNDRSDSREQIAGIQRSRLLAAAAGTIDEFGYGNVTVAHITSRARVSRRTFYELFANREECLTTLLEGVVDSVESELAAVSIDGLRWCERVRVALSVILSFLDREPVLARVCVVQAMRSEPAVLERRERILARLIAAVDDGRRESAATASLTPLTAEGVVGAAFTIVYGRLQRRERGPLIGLLGELMGMIVLPYLGPAAARREQARGVPDPLQAAVVGACPVQRDADPLGGVAMRLTYRTATVLEVVCDRPGASNRQVADDAEIHDQGQVSKLLARLQRLGLLANAGAGHLKGEPNAWTLTPKGEQVTRSIRTHAAGRRQAA